MAINKKQRAARAHAARRTSKAGRIGAARRGNPGFRARGDERRQARAPGPRGGVGAGG